MNLKETFLILSVVALLIMVVGLTTIVKTLRRHKAIQLDWSGMGFNLTIKGTALGSSNQRSDT